MIISKESEYDQKQIKVLELLWGKGFLSPGGTDEIDLIVNQRNLENKTILDIGCGSGGALIYFSEKFNIKQAIGIDIEPHVINQANFHKNNSIMYSNKNNTELQRAILEASNGIYPVGLFSSKKIDKAFLKKQDGYVLLNAIYLISSSNIADIAALQAGLASLVKLGLINDFKSISNELLIMEYFKKI